MSEDEEIPPLDPKKVAVFAILIVMIIFAGWRFWRAREAVNAVAEASKDYRKLFPARTAEAPPPAPKPVLTTEAPVSGIGMLKIDDDMRAPKPVAPPAAPPQAPPQAEPPPIVAAPAEAVAPSAPVRKAFNQPRLNSGGYSGLNGGAGVTFSGRAVGGGGGGAVAPSNPALSTAPASGKK